MSEDEYDLQDRVMAIYYQVWVPGGYTCQTDPGICFNCGKQHKVSEDGDDWIDACDGAFDFHEAQMRLSEDDSNDDEEDMQAELPSYHNICDLCLEPKPVPEPELDHDPLSKMTDEQLDEELRAANKELASADNAYRTQALVCTWMQEEIKAKVDELHLASIKAKELKSKLFEPSDRLDDAIREVLKRRAAEREHEDSPEKKKRRVA